MFITLTSDDCLSIKDGFTILSRYVHSQLNFPVGTIVNHNIKLINAWLSFYDPKLAQELANWLTDFFEDPCNLQDEFVDSQIIGQSELNEAN